MPIESLLRDVSADRVRDHVERITTAIPSRLAGSQNGRRMAEYSRDALRESGVAAEIREMPGLVSFPEPGELRVLAPREISIEANTLGHSVPTLSDGISGELMDVRTGAFEEYEGRDATGRITLSELSYHPARHEKQRIAGLLGSTGCVMMNWGHPENTAVPFGSVKPAWGNPTPETVGSEMPTLPCIGIARTAGLQLREMLAAGPVRVWFRANVENAWRPVQITVGEVEAGRGHGDVVLVGGHQDSWPGPQATDNAAGNACMLELARVFQARRGELKRGIVFGFWTAHETGTMVGSSWFADRDWDRLRRHAVGYLQIDQPSCLGTTTWSTASAIEMRDFHQRIERELLPGRDISWRRSTKTGDSSFFGLGIPMLTGQGYYTKAELDASALATLGWWHHSVENTIDKMDWGYMGDHIRVYAAWLWELCTATLLPYRFEPVADAFVERLDALAGAGHPVGIGSAAALAREFKAAASRFDAAAEAWRRRYAEGQADEGAAAILNGCMKRLSRLLIPLASTAKGTYGQDVYGYTPQGSMIPSLFDVPRLGPLPDGEARWLLETRLVRERNRVADGLDDARSAIEAALRELS